MVFNTTTLIGNLGSDIELRTTPAGSKVCNVNLAQNRTYVDRNGDTHEDTSWFRLVAWGKTAERMAERLGRGSRVLVEGRLQARVFERDGQRHERVEVNVLSFQTLARSTSPIEDEEQEVSEAEVPF